MDSIVDTHPQREKIVQMLLEDVPLRRIARTVSPPVSHVALYRFRKKRIDPAMQGAGVLSNALKTLAESNGEVVQNLEPKQVTAMAIAADPYMSRVQKHQELADKALEMALEERDYRGIASLLNADYRGTELKARLDGRLDAAAIQNNIQIVIPAGGPGVPVATGPGRIEDGDIIDITPAEG